MSSTDIQGVPRRVAVVVDGSVDAPAALRRAASQARQRNAWLDVIRVLPPDADGEAAIQARVRLAEFTRRECPYGVGAPVRLRVERGTFPAVLPQLRDGTELLITTTPQAPEPDSEPAATQPAARAGRLWTRILSRPAAS